MFAGETVQDSNLPSAEGLDLLGGSPSAQANLQVSTIGKIVETPSGYSFSMQELHTRILFTQKMELNEKCGGMEQISKHLSNV
jgi:hypothetical protein